jgi:hypothetical protein
LRRPRAFRIRRRAWRRIPDECVDEAGHYGAATGVDNLTFRTNQRLDLSLCADAFDLSAADEHGCTPQNREILHLIPNARARRSGERDEFAAVEDRGRPGAVS